MLNSTDRNVPFSTFFSFCVTPSQDGVQCVYHTGIVHILNTMYTGLHRYDES
jgi:hypothetical protein